MQMNKNKNNFESNLRKLEDIVEKLENGEVDLEESVKLYEEGMKLKKACEDKLKSIEGQMINITSFTPEMRLEDQEFYKRDIRLGTRVRAKPGYYRKNWNMAKLMKR